MLKKSLFFFLLMLTPLLLMAQEDTVKTFRDKLKLVAYIDNYWGVDFNDPFGDNRPDFLLNYSRDNTFSVNLAILEGHYEADDFSVSLGLQAGDFPGLNVPEEDDLLRLIYKALIGVKISKRVWVDMGVMTSYIGAETPLGFQNLTLTRSVLAENTPYFFSGVRTEIYLKKYWYLYVHLNNGWINNQETIFNPGSSLGFQLVYQTDDENFISFTTYFGDEQNTTSAFEQSFYQDFHLRLQLNDHWKVLFTGNLGTRFVATVEQYQWWGGLVAVGQYKINDDFEVAARFQYIRDPNGVIIPSAVPGGFVIYGISSNLDYRINKYIKLRGEAQEFLSPNEVFTENGDNPTKQNFMLTFALQLFFPDFP